MRISDILGMSLANLWKRKMRTVLTVLGVVIGTTSIVIMLSLGIGLKQAMMEQVGSAGGLTEILVYSDAMYGSDDLLLDDSTVDLFCDMDFVEGAEPELYYSMPIQISNYEGYVDVVGVSRNYLEKIDLGEGDYPEKGSQLSVIVGNQVAMNMMDMTTGEWMDYESEDAPNVNFMSAQLIGGVAVEDTYESEEMVSDEESDFVDPTFSDDSSDFESDEDFSVTDDSSSDVDDYSDEEDYSDYEDEYYDDEFYEEEIYSNFTSDTKRVQLKVAGMTAGDSDTYTEYSYCLYTDIDLLKDFLKQNYNDNDIIPGQPTDNKGKPYRDLKYSQIVVKVDEAENVELVLEEIQNMGYQAETNKEWLEETEKYMLIIEAVLGGIGAVAMLVAAISIANTMTMSIYERTKEIGVMKVLGCGLGNIRSMFLTEAAFIGFIGGIVGIVLSFILSLLANQLVAPLVMGELGLDANISEIPFWLVLAAIVFSTIVGMLAGFFPAQRATRLSPLAAIRNE